MEHIVSHTGSVCIPVYILYKIYSLYYTMGYVINLLIHITILDI